MCVKENGLVDTERGTAILLFAMYFIFKLKNVKQI